LGVTIAQASIVQAEAETLHGISAAYLGILYADQQIRLTNVGDQGIRQRIKDLQTLVTDPMLGKQRRGVVLKQHEDLIQSFLYTLEGRVQEAEQGKLRALAALREAMGVAPDCPVDVPQRDLPCPRLQPPPLAELIALAVARRGEMIQATVFAEVVCLEIDAQAQSHRPNMRTFASGSDIHAKLVPTGEPGGVNFRPAIVGPDMPSFLTGARDARVRQARDYYERAQATVAKARNLVTLEVEDLYRRWLEKAKKAEQLERAYKEAEKFSNSIKDQYRRVQREEYPNLDEVINAGLITMRLQLEWKEAHYQALLALAALERATAGGFAVDFDAAPTCAGEGKEAPNNAEGKQ